MEYIFLSIILILITIIIVLVYRFKRNLSLIETKLHSIQNEKSDPLVHALSKFAQGDLSVQLNLLKEERVLKPKGLFGNIWKNIDLLEKSHELANSEFNSLTNFVSKRFCFIGGDAYAQGKQAAEFLVLEGFAGEIAILTGSLDSSGQSLRRKGFVSGCEEHKNRFKISHIEETHGKPEVAYQILEVIFKSANPPKAIYVTDGASPGGAAKFIFDNKLTQAVKLICHDLSEEIVKYIQNGCIRVSLVESTFASGHDPVLYLYNHIISGWQPRTPRMVVESQLVDLSNLSKFWSGSHPVLSKEYLEKLPKPELNKTNRPIRIAVIGCENSPYWYPIRDGVQHAAEILKHYNVEVEWIVKKGYDLTTDIVVPMIKEAVSKKIDGLALIAEEQSIVPEINNLVDKNIPVVTFITEPSSLRAFISTVSDQSKKLLQLNSEVVQSSEMVNKTSQHLNNAVKTGVTLIQETAEVAQSNQQELSIINIELQKINEKAEETKIQATMTLEELHQGNQTIKQSSIRLTDLAENYKKMYGLFENLKVNANYINNSIEAITEIAERVNVLAFNAAIEAARAGHLGVGFKVLSEEIRTLSNKSGESSEAISKQLGEIKKGIDSTFSMMRNGMATLEGTLKEAKQTEYVFEKIKIQIEDEQNRAREVSVKIHDMNGRSIKMSQKLETMASYAKKSAETLDNIEQDGKDLIENFQKVYLGAMQLNEIASVEETLLARFVK